MPQVKIKACDMWFSKCIRERANWKCEVCGKKYLQGTMGLHCSHFYSRRHRSTRWHGDNAAAMCFGCHQRMGGEPIRFAEWVREHLGDGLYGLLKEKHNEIVKIPKSEEKEISKHYRAEYALMQQARLEGQTGRLEFESYQ